MAAAKRSSGSGIIVALVIFALLAVVGLGFAIWFYQQLRIAKQIIAADQSAFQETVAAEFTANGWELSTETPSPDLGVTYTRESYNDVVRKLEQAAEYEQVTMPLLGWESLEGIRTAMAESPLQREAEAAGEPVHRTMRPLLDQYENSYETLSEETGNLRQRNDRLAADLDAANQKQVQTQQRLTQQVNDLRQAHRQALNELGAAKTDLEARVRRESDAAAEWQRKYQQEAQAHRGDVADLRDEVQMWREKYERAVAGPGPREKLVADGSVIEVWPDYEFVMIEGGADRERKENETYVVYDVTPDGENRAKGRILVGQVNEHTSLATIAEEDGYILEGDLFVSVERWDQFQRKTAGAGVQ
jgi:hypothetical protein